MITPSSIIQHIGTINYAYFETYSLFRNTAYTNSKKLVEQEIEVLLKKGRLIPLEREEKERYDYLQSLLPIEYQLLALDEYTPFQDKVARVEVGTSLAMELDCILSTIMPPPVAYAACIPIYRDVMVFYDAANCMVGKLYVCFECAFMATSKTHSFHVGHELFGMLGRYLQKLGHPLQMT
ncbi:hypothetical protein LX64_02361 [Chitinophaga skermanii]|uniref:Uncharacterized protein n=1 Tax=Chitinophaga skermanii TaxID=331697 RepID=A0A327QTX8_9BACT|nr:hypothetical protein [Chitinophaga skermanii]RAJ05207.1 hypothetical protein LX64_02361 [Chitinophaga skermanii]